VLGVEQIVVAEAMLLGQSLGLDPAVLASVINSSTGGCWASSVNNPVPSALPDKSPPCERDYEGGFATALMLKVGIAPSSGPGFTDKNFRTWDSLVTLQYSKGALCPWEKRRKIFILKLWKDAPNLRSKTFRLCIGS